MSDRADGTGRDGRASIGRLPRVVVLLLLAAALQACGDDGVGPDQGPRLEVWPEIGLLLGVGDTIQLTAFAFNELGAALEDAPVSWSSSDTAVADADGNGLVTARGVGSAIVVARAAGGVDSAFITVDPRLILRNYCGGCHGSAGHSGTLFPLTSCPACHLMSRDPEEANHGFVSTDHRRASEGYELVGAHAPLLCEACHQLNVAGGTPHWLVDDQNDCVGCHQAAYDSVHAASGIPTSCNECHSEIAWDSVTFDHALVSGGFELLGRHQEIECTSCHDDVNGAPLFEGANQDECFTCHVDDYERQHGGTGIPTACLNCHTNEGWGVVDFDHAAVSGGFDLLGVHAVLACSYCHDIDNGSQPLWQPADENDCVSCHRSDYDAQHAGSGTPLSCGDCHTVDGPWSNVTFDHAQVSGGFALIGAHTQLACLACHRPDGSPIFITKNEANCVLCHRADYDIQHAGSGIPMTCTDCHSVDGPWSDVSFDHAQASGGFMLMGRHQMIPCTSCHDAVTFEPRHNPAGHEDCITCHQSDYDSRHQGSGTPTTCLDCHTNEGWGVSDFDHAAVSQGFDLVGAHLQLGCSNCHDASNNDQPFWDPVDENDCATCHQADYDARHGGSGFSTNCLQCHTIESWTGAVFDHLEASAGFELIGAHGQLLCTACHQTDGTPLFNTKDETNCVFCHQSDYDGQHAGSGIPVTCTDCHTVDGPWTDVWFDHGFASGGFDLVGAHATLACTLCHDSSNGAALYLTKDENDCVICHQAEYDGQHTGTGIPTTCGDCHTPVGPWANVSFDHGQASSGFDLVGAHATASCTACHDPSNGVPVWETNDERNCAVCHQGLYDSQHGGTGIPVTCGDCHNTSTWTGAVFDHPAASGGFDLIGAHTALACTACHDPSNGVPIWSTNDENLCIACHQADYDSRHAGTGFPTSGCTDCHTVNGPWSSVSFDHTSASGGFALVGKHSVIACTGCHDAVGGAPLFTTRDDNDCIACHEALYVGAHGQGGGTPTTCENCHTRNTWTEISFDHDAQYFPIYTLRHRGKWNSCSDCHTDPGDFAIFSCLNCHAHSRSRMDSDHSGENGYQYDSIKCLECHPKGIAD